LLKRSRLEVTKLLSLIAFVSFAVIINLSLMSWTISKQALVRKRKPKVVARRQDFQWTKVAATTQSESERPLLCEETSSRGHSKENKQTNSTGSKNSCKTAFD